MRGLWLLILDSGVISFRFVSTLSSLFSSLSLPSKLTSPSSLYHCQSTYTGPRRHNSHHPNHHPRRQLPPLHLPTSSLSLLPTHPLPPPLPHPKRIRHRRRSFLNPHQRRRCSSNLQHHAHCSLAGEVGLEFEEGRGQGQRRGGFDGKVYGEGGEEWVGAVG